MDARRCDRHFKVWVGTCSTRWLGRHVQFFVITSRQLYGRLGVHAWMPVALIFIPVSVSTPLRCKNTTSVDIEKRAIKKLFTHVESHASAVSLLESGEQRYIKAINNNN